MTRELGSALTLHIKRFNELTTEELYKLLQLRSAVFVVEQNCVYQDLDNADRQALHLWITDSEGNIKALSRVCAAHTHIEEVSIGRVISTERRKGYGDMIVRASVEAALSEFNTRMIDIEAQQYTMSLYEKIGFVQTSGVYLLDGIPHVRMRYCNKPQ